MKKIFSVLLSAVLVSVMVISSNAYGDVTTLQMFIAKLKDMNSLARFHADANSNGYVDVEDVTYLQFGLAGN